MKLYFATVLYSFIFLFNTIYSKDIVILIPGSFSQKAQWHKPNGDFYKELDKQSSSLKKKLTTFKWSCIPIYHEISKAAVNLCELLLSYPDDTQITIITHSHGGNIVNVASQILYDPIEKIVEKYSSITVEKILQEATSKLNHTTQNQNNKPTISGKTDIHPPDGYNFSLTPTTEIRNINTLKYWIKVLKIKKLLEKKEKLRNKSNSKNKRFLINKHYQLGTPVDTKHYMPQMHVIKNLFNIYSNADIIQPVIGLFKRKYPEHKRIVNLSIFIEQTGWTQQDTPTHTQIHHPLLAKWILSIPENLGQDKVGNFENFNYQDGTISFTKNNVPVYIGEADYPLIKPTRFDNAKNRFLKLSSFLRKTPFPSSCSTRSSA